jgi:hypothetical protein
MSQQRKYSQEMQLDAKVNGDGTLHHLAARVMLHGLHDTV